MYATNNSNTAYSVFIRSTKDLRRTSQSDALSELGYEYNVNYDIWMMPVVKNIQHFKQWEAAYPFYTNVQKEGVVLYEAA